MKTTTKIKYVLFTIMFVVDMVASVLASWANNYPEATYYLLFGFFILWVIKGDITK